MSGSTGAVGRAGQAESPGVHSVDRLAFTVPDMKTAERFYTSFGLTTHDEPWGLGLSAPNTGFRPVSVIEGSRKQLHHVRFGAFEHDLPTFAARLEALAIERVDPPSGFDSNGIWCRDPDGTLIEIAAAAKSSPSHKTPLHMVSEPEGTRAAPYRSTAGRAYPTRLSHILLFTRDVDETVRFYSAALGMRLSDRSGSDIAFMHGIHGSDHHMVAFLRSDGPGLHHLSWDVKSIHDIGLGAMYMAEQGYAAGWGLGRHVLGSNYFHYIRDPWGSYSEYSCDIDFIAAGSTWDTGDHRPEDAFYVWGPPPPADFGQNYELDDARP